MKKTVAIIGSGISGLTAAFELHKKYDVHVYEKNTYLGGHTHTHEIFEGKKKYSIDSGFIVFNNKTYPNFIEFLDRLGVAKENTNMSFSVNYPTENFEWSGKDINSLIFKNKKEKYNAGKHPVNNVEIFASIKRFLLTFFSKFLS